MHIHKALADYTAVFAAQGNYVAYSAYTANIGVLLYHGFKSAVKRRAEFQRNARAREVFKCRRAIGAVGVYHGFGAREYLGRLVVVGNYKLHAEFVYLLSLGNARDAVIHGNDKLYALLMQFAHGVYRHAVAFLTLVDIICNVRTHALQVAVKDSGSGNAVAVVIAVNTNKAVGIYKFIDSISRLLHIRSNEGVFQLVIAEKIDNLLKIAETPSRHKLQRKKA